MKRNIRWTAAALVVCAAMIFTAGCGKPVFTDVGLAADNIEVKVDSAVKGKLPTVCAADREEVSPRGQNISPAVSWEAAEGAAVYVVVMTDTDASLLHMVAVTENTSLARGEVGGEGYMGPYPQKCDPHRYRVEVFALKERTEIPATVDKPVEYYKLVKALNTAGKKRGNVLARGNTVVTYKFGDNTPEQPAE